VWTQRWSPQRSLQYHGKVSERPVIRSHTHPTNKSELTRCLITMQERLNIQRFRVRRVKNRRFSHTPQRRNFEQFQGCSVLRMFLNPNALKCSGAKEYERIIFIIEKKRSALFTSSS
jgi:hypothetical protein